MAKNNMWGVKLKDDKPIHVVLFVSRNKDNDHIKGFKERSKSFITTEDINSYKILNDFYSFSKAGVYGETSRMYYSLNARNSEKIYKELMHFLIDNPDFNLTSIQSKLASIAAKKECAAEKKWLFDFDISDYDSLAEFMNDIKDIDDSVELKYYNTIHGFAVTCSHGFDTRTLLEKWNTVTLKRDDLLLVKWYDNYYMGNED